VSGNRWRPRTLPRIRDELIDLYRAVSEHGQGIDTDGRITLSREADALQRSQLYWVTSEMAALVMHAARTMPAWSPAQHRPAECGLLIWDEGVTTTAWTGAPKHVWTRSPLGPPVAPQVTVHGIAWRPRRDRIAVDVLTRPELLPAGSLSLTWRDAPLFGIGSLLLRGERVKLPATDLGTLVGATWVLMQTPTLVEPRDLDGPAGDAARQGMRGASAVRIVDLRRRLREPVDPADPGQGTGRRLRYRIPVGGYWSHHWVGKGRTRRELRYTQPHERGPKVPLVEPADTVRVWRR
jgi:hypothetical protein